VLEKYECPICLEDHLLAPRMTKCGHIFCGTCIKQHIKTRTCIFYYFYIRKDGLLTKCPLCYSTIDAKDLRPCKIVHVKIPKIGEMIELHLVTKLKHCIILKDEAVYKKGDLAKEPFLYNPDSLPLSRVVQVYDITPIIESERKQIKDAIWFANSCQTLEIIPYLNEIMEELDGRLEIFNKLFNGLKPGILLAL